MEQEGNISEWNEGSFKSMRLHKAQMMINYAKLNIQGRNEFCSGFNYNLLITNIGILYDEGKAKYNGAEIDEIDKIKVLTQTLIQIKPPHSQVHVASVSGHKVTYVLNRKNLEDLEKISEIFETLVRLYNDKHGLSTRNVTKTKGLCG